MDGPGLTDVLRREEQMMNAYTHAAKQASSVPVRGYPGSVGTAHRDLREPRLLPALTP